MKDIIWYFVFGIIGAILLIGMAAGAKTQSPLMGLGLALALTLILIIILFLLDRSNIGWIEGFTFRVSPWKQQCLLKGGPCCCKKGFVGQHRKSFEYSGDNARLCGAGCSEYKDEPDCSCESGKAGEVVEGYCSSCEQEAGCSKCSEACNNPRLVIKTMTDTPQTVPIEEEGVKEGYCSKCDGVYSPKADLVEGYCGSCSGNAY